MDVLWRYGWPGLLALVLVAGCQKDKPRAAKPSASTLTVVVAHPVEQDVIDFCELPGQVAAGRSVSVRARVTGVIKEIHYAPGATVEAGNKLFSIESESCDLRLAGASAELVGREAALVLAEQELKAIDDLHRTGKLKEIDLQQKEAARNIAKAARDQAREHLKLAELEARQTTVRAPIAGRAGRNLVEVGQFVGAGEPTPLTTIVDDAVVYAYVDVAEAQAMAYRKLVLDGQKQVRPAVRVLLGPADEAGCRHRATLDWIDSAVNPATRTVRLRARYTNGEGPYLMDGASVRVRLEMGTKRVLLVPSSAILGSPSGPYVLVANAKNVVELRPVRAGARFDGTQAIEGGLTVADRVIIEGLESARPGTEVTATTAPPPTPPMTRPTTAPTTVPVTRPATAPIIPITTAPTSKPTTFPATRPATLPATLPATRPAATAPASKPSITLTTTRPATAPAVTRPSAAPATTRSSVTLAPTTRPAAVTTQPAATLPWPVRMPGAADASTQDAMHRYGTLSSTESR